MRRKMRIHCNAKCDAAGIRAGQHGAAQNDRTRCHHSGCSGFFETCASYRNWPNGGDRNRTIAVSLGKAGCRDSLRRTMRRTFAGSHRVARPCGRPRGRHVDPGRHEGRRTGGGRRKNSWWCLGSIDRGWMEEIAAGRGTAWSGFWSLCAEKRGGGYTRGDFRPSLRGRE